MNDLLIINSYWYSECKRYVGRWHQTLMMNGDCFIILRFFSSIQLSSLRGFSFYFEIHLPKIMGICSLITIVYQCAIVKSEKNMKIMFPNQILARLLLFFVQLIFLIRYLFFLVSIGLTNLISHGRELIVLLLFLLLLKIFFLFQQRER